MSVWKGDNAELPEQRIEATRLTDHERFSEGLTTASAHQQTPRTPEFAQQKKTQDVQRYGPQRRNRALCGFVRCRPGVRRHRADARVDYPQEVGCQHYHFDGLRRRDGDVSVA